MLGVFYAGPLSLLWSSKQLDEQADDNIIQHAKVSFKAQDHI